jgi:hypothetical protein
MPESGGNVSCTAIRSRNSLPHLAGLPDPRSNDGRGQADSNVALKTFDGLVRWHPGKQ